MIFLSLLCVPALPGLLTQGLLTVSLDGKPVRFGVPLPAAALAQGLRLQGGGALQWRRLPVGGALADPVWVELAIVGATGSTRVIGGGAPESADGRGPAFVREEEEVLLPHGRERRVRWRWSDGSIDECARTELSVDTEIGGEVYTAGEARTVWTGAATTRADVVCALPRRLFEVVSLLPSGGRSAAAVQKHLASLVPLLRELPGARGAGDFGRSGKVVTNLEFDTTLALLRAAVALRDEKAFAMAGRTAQHLRDRDLDPRSGLPFPHGLDHRTGVPAPGHAWLEGLLHVGLLRADDGHLAAARNMGLALAACPPMGEGRQELARDYAWPLLELEALLAIDPDPGIARAADRLATAIARRYDAQARTFRFGEGEVGDGYLERGWITGGIVVPALQAHLRRVPNTEIAACVAAVQQALLDQIGRARPGLPTHWRCAGGRTFAEHREAHAAEAMLVLEAFEPADLRRLLRRETIGDSIAEVPAPDDPDLATKFSMVARCTWVWR
jgi:hypothetical protein